MMCPEHLYYAAIAVVTGAELGAAALGREVFGRAAWVLVAVFAASLSVALLGGELPLWQFWFHTAGFIAGVLVARRPAGHLACALFVPMATADLAALNGFVSPAVWWWTIYYMAFAQLAVLGAGAQFHPLGRAIGRWARRKLDQFEAVATQRTRGVKWT